MNHAPYELYLYHLATSDAHLQEVRDTCKSGARLQRNCHKATVPHKGFRLLNTRMPLLSRPPRIDMNNKNRRL